MRTAKPAIALDPRRFGRCPIPFRIDRASLQMSEDLQLFLSTFAAGFLVVSILIA